MRLNYETLYQMELLTGQWGFFNLTRSLLVPIFSLSDTVLPFKNRKSQTHLCHFLYFLFFSHEKSLKHAQVWNKEDKNIQCDRNGFLLFSVSELLLHETAASGLHCLMVHLTCPFRSQRTASKLFFSNNDCYFDRKCWVIGAGPCWLITQEKSDFQVMTNIIFKTGEISCMF